MVLNRADFNVVTGEKVDDISESDDGIFTVTTSPQNISMFVFPLIGSVYT